MNTVGLNGLSLNLCYQDIISTHMVHKKLLVSLFIFLCLHAHSQSWPATDSITKPWTRWWWLGSAVNEKGLEYNLEALRAAGIGGVEITPIYGIKGQEQAFGGQ